MFDRNNTFYRNHFLATNNKFTLEIIDFNINNKKTKDPNEYGKYLKITLNESKLANQMVITANKKYQEATLKAHREEFLKFSDNLSSNKKNSRYDVLYNDEFEYDLLSVLDDTYGFAYLLVKDNVIHILFNTKEDGFNFKLERSFGNDLLIYFKQKYSESFKILDKIIQINNKKG